MKKMNSGLLAIILMSVGFSAAANGPNNPSLRQHRDNHPNVVYHVAQQTTTPNETLKKLVNDAPKTADGKRYKVKMTIVEVPEYRKGNRMPTIPTVNTAPVPIQQ